MQCPMGRNECGGMPWYSEVLLYVTNCLGKNFLIDLWIDDIIEDRYLGDWMRDDANENRYELLGRLIDRRRSY